MTVLLVFVGGALGAPLRYVIDRLVQSRVDSVFPWGTFAVNVSGALVLGLLAGLAVQGNALVLAGGGLLGSYTTFSTWMLESDRLVEDGQVPAAVLNVTLTLAVGLGAAELGRLIGGA